MHLFRRQHNYTTFQDALLYLPAMAQDCKDSTLERLNAAACPRYLCGVAVPDNLNGISFGAYSDLCNAMQQDSATAMITFCSVVLGVNDAAVARAAAVDVWGFSAWVCQQVTNITQLFNSINVQRTSEEEQAGIGRLQFGIFGMLDWYAKRMGITDHNAVNEIAWVRIYQCLKNDTEENAYQRRLQKIYNDKIKTKK